MDFYAYVYRHPETLIPMYVGKVSGARSKAHLRRKDASRFARTIRKLADQGLVPHIELIPAMSEDHAFFLESCLIEEIADMFDPDHKGTAWPWTASVQDEAWMYK